MNLFYNDLMQRRQFMIQASTLCATAALPGLVSMPAWAQDIDKVQNLSAALRWIDVLEAAPGLKTTGAWQLSAILEHLSQSIEMSMDGFPEPKSALFQNTLGAAAFTVFKWRGKMSHSLVEPIPGAATLTQVPQWRPAALRLRAAITRFNAHAGSLKPHFAYGALSKADYSLAHTFHIANHQDEIAINRLA
jgi:hypothetical protein